MNLTAKSLILDLLSTLRRGTMPVRALVAAGQLFGIAENNVRVSLARLLAAGVIERDERGAYRLGAGAQAVQSQVVSWRRTAERMCPWDGGWVAVHTGSRARARGRAGVRERRALAFFGFRDLEPGLALRPDNLAGGVESVRAQLRALGLRAELSVFSLRGLEPERDARARALWDAATLREAYARSRAELERSSAALENRSSEETMRETFLIGGRVLRQIVLDPLLPDPILPAGELSSLVDAMREYDLTGRASWAQFLDGFGVPHLRAPLDARMTETAHGLATGAGLHRQGVLQ